MGWHKSTGKIVYDPWRGGMKTRTDWWCVVEVDKEITRYYRWWIDKEVINPLEFKNKGLQIPSWDAHVSIIRGERPYGDLVHLWKKYHGRVVEFEYEHFPETGTKETFWQVEVRSEFLTNIRKEFGFPTNYPFHMTVGKLD